MHIPAEVAVAREEAAKKVDKLATLIETGEDGDSASDGCCDCGNLEASYVATLLKNLAIKIRND